MSFYAKNFKKDRQTKTNYLFFELVFCISPFSLYGVLCLSVSVGTLLGMNIVFLFYLRMYVWCFCQKRKIIVFHQKFALWAKEGKMKILSTSDRSPRVEETLDRAWEKGEIYLFLLINFNL